MIGSFAAVTGWIGAGVGSIVLLGWLLNVSSLKSVLPGLALMQPNTALSLALTGLALLGTGRANFEGQARRIASGLAGLATAIGLLTLFEYAFGVDLGIDLLLFGRVPGSETPQHPGRMSLMTAACIASLGASLLLLDAKARLPQQASQSFALMATLLALLDLIGYAYGVRFLYMVSAYSTMALHTALTLFVLGVGTLASRPGSGLIRRFLADDAGGWLLRNLLPLTVALPLLTGGLRVAGEETGLFNPRFGSAVLVLGNIVALIGLLWWTAGRLSDMDDGRRRAERSVTRQDEWLRTTLTSIGDAVITTDVEGRVTFMNPVAESMTGWPQADAAGKPLEDVFHILDEATRGTARSPARRALREGVIVGLANHTTLVARDGTERAIDDSAAPIRDGDEFAGAVLVFRDVTVRRGAERALIESERRLEIALNAARMAAWVRDPASDRLLATERLTGVLGLVPGAEPRDGLKVLDLLHPEDVEPHRTKMTEAIETGGGYYSRFRITRPVDGRVAWIDEWGQADAGQSDGPLRLVGVLTDVTDRVQAEEEAREARSRLESTLEAGEVGTWEYDVVNNIVRADLNLARMFGVSPEEEACGPLDAYTRAIHPDDRGRVATAIGRAMESGHGYEADYRLVGSDGSVRWVVARGRVERDGAGRAVRLPGIVVDVTGQRRAEAELRASENQRRLALDSAELGTWSIDSATNVLTTDERFRIIFLGCPTPLSLEEAFAVIHPDDRGRVQESVTAAMNPDSPAPYVEEYRVARHDGTIRWVFAKGRANFEPTAGSRRLVSFDGTLMDITDRKAMEDELRSVAADLSEADHRKDEFLATLAHELRNPLAPIRNGLQIMKVAGDDRKAVDESRSLMERQVTHMVRLIDDLMDVSRITRNKLELRRERIDLATVVRHAVETSRPLIEAAGHGLAVTLPARPILVDADLTRLSQVFSNLLNNAAKYTERGGDIALVAERFGTEVVVTVRDNGVGIPPEVLPKLFVMFTQVDRSLERSQGGLGIGLSLVKTLVEMHGGSVEASSGGHGLGSEFVVRLPVVLAAPTRSAPDENKRTSGPTTALRILVVDDNVDSARTLARLLRLLGHETRMAHDGGEAVEAAEVYRPELILLDIGLPVMNGYEVARAIRGRGWGREVAIVALTGWGQDDDRRRSKEAGIDDHLVKPVDPATLEFLLAGMAPRSDGRSMPATS